MFPLIETGITGIEFTLIVVFDDVAVAVVVQFAFDVNTAYTTSPFANAELE